MEGADKTVTLDDAIGMFSYLVGLNYAVSIKHVGGKFYVEVPVTLKGDPCFGKQAEIMEMAKRNGLDAVQTGMTLRVFGR